MLKTSSNKIRILFIDHTPFVGGAELVLLAHLKNLDRNYFEPFVLCSNTVPQLIKDYEDSGAKVFSCEFAKLKTFNPLVIFRFLKTASTVCKVIKENQINIVVTNTERAMYVGTLAAILTKTPLIWLIRDYEYNRKIFNLLQKFPRKILCVSNSIRNYYGGDIDNKFEVIYVGSDMYKKLENVNESDILKTKKELEINDGYFVIGFVGRLVDWKGPQVLVEAIKLIRNDLKVQALIIGTGGNQAGNIEPQVKKMVVAYDIEARVKLTGYRTDIPLLLKTMNVFCLPSIGPEPFSTVIVEAMMAELPVISTNTGGSPEIIGDSKTGLIIPPNDPEALAAAIEKLASNKELCQKISASAKNVVMADFTERSITGKLEKIYESII